MNNNSEIFNKIYLTLFLLCVYRFGSFIPVPGIDQSALEVLVNKNSDGVMGMFNLLSGGSLGRMSLFALAVMPYITASIVVQLMTFLYQPLASLKSDSVNGRKKINKISRYLTVFFASFQGYAISLGLLSSSPDLKLVVLPFALFKFTTVVTLVVGTVFLMWLGEEISSRGIGNGTSLIIFTGIVSQLPSSLFSVFEMSRKGAISFLLFFFVTFSFGWIVIISYFF